jgi:hypothetical protein
MSDRCPYYAYIPKDRAGNLNWRLAVARRAMVDAEFREGIRQMCAEDPLFFLAGFCWAFEPRLDDALDKQPAIIPMIPWPQQEEATLTLMECWGKEDLIFLKSREQGFTVWMMAMATWATLFIDMFTMGVISKDKDSVEIAGDLGTLLPKIDFQLERLPEWMKPRDWEPVPSQLKRINHDNGALVRGFAATQDAASGGRTQLFFMDELAKFPRGDDYAVLDSIQHVTNCRIMGIDAQGGQPGRFRQGATTARRPRSSSIGSTIRSATAACIASSTARSSSTTS